MRVERFQPTNQPTNQDGELTVFPTRSWIKVPFLQQLNETIKSMLTNSAEILPTQTRTVIHLILPAWILAKGYTPGAFLFIYKTNGRATIYELRFESSCPLVDLSASINGSIKSITMNYKFAPQNHRNCPDQRGTVHLSKRMCGEKQQVLLRCTKLQRNQIRLCTAQWVSLETFMEIWLIGDYIYRSKYRSTHARWCISSRPAVGQQSCAPANNILSAVGHRYCPTLSSNLVAV